MPALHELARAAMRLMFSGDASQWDRALQMPHYNTRSMPAISLHTGMHLIQARPRAVLQGFMVGFQGRHHTRSMPATSLHTGMRHAPARCAARLQMI